MAQQLFPTFDVPATVAPTKYAKPSYPRSFLFDFSTNDFAIDGRGRFIEIDGQSAWLQWCQMSVLTVRLAHVVYSQRFGMMPARDGPNRAWTQSYYEREITNTLKVDPRTESVRGFSFAWDADALYISFTVTPVVGKAQQMEVQV